MFILKSAEKILPAGGKYIQLDTLLQADGPMDKPGRYHNRTAGVQFRTLSPNGIAEASGKNITALGMEMGMIRSDRAVLEGNLHGQQLIIPGQKPPARRRRSCYFPYWTVFGVFKKRSVVKCHLKSSL